MHLSLLGFGLIGGSLARALRARETDAAAPRTTIAAWSPSGRGPRLALEEGMVDAAPTSIEAALADAEVVVLAGPPLSCLELVDALAGPLAALLPPGAFVTDVASTKGAIARRAEAAGLRFTGGHPMAGSEMTGYEQARADLFVGRPWVVVPTSMSGAGDVDRLVELAARVQARPIVLDADTHDAATAGISHLPRLLSTALVEAVAGRAGADAAGWGPAAELASTGWRDMTRLARGDTAMYAGIAATNAAQLAARVREAQAVLGEWLVELEALASAGASEEERAAAEARIAARLDEARMRASGGAGEARPGESPFGE